ncbi:MAG: hypothetical protein H7Y60_04995 [Rhodospirillaceae bacterium]|nr:hypothetical protein [Rhodospirillales bacterium]
MQEQPRIGLPGLAPPRHRPPRQADLIALSEFVDQDTGTLSGHLSRDMPMRATGDGGEHGLHGPGLAQMNPHELTT